MLHNSSCLNRFRENLTFWQAPDDNDLEKCKSMQRLEFQVTASFGIISSCYILLALFGTLLNGLVIAALYKLKLYNNVYEVFLIMLTLSDLLSSIVVSPLMAYQCLLMFQNIYRKEGYPEIVFSLSTGFFIASLTTIAFITREMYLTVVYCFKPPRSRKKYTIILVLLWVMWFIFMFCTIIAELVNPILIVAVAFIIILIIIVCTGQFKLYRETIMIKKRNIANQNLEDRKKLIKTVYTTTIIVTAFGISIIPNLICIFVSFTKNLPIFQFIVGPWCFFLGCCNQICNPLIYCFRLSNVRRKIYDMLTF